SVPVAERQERDEAGGRNSRDLLDLIQFGPVNGSGKILTRGLTSGNRGLQRKHVLGRETFVSVQQMIQRAQQQARAGKQNNRETQLNDDQHVAKFLLTAAACDGAGGFA